MTLEAAFVLLGIFALLMMVLVMLRAGASFAPWLPSSTAACERALSFIGPKPGMRFADLGCGDGRMVFLAHRTFGMESFGCEISPLPYLVAKIRQLRYLRRPVSIRLKNLFAIDLSRFNVIYLYGLPKTLNTALLPKLERKLKPGTFVISYNFSLKTKTPLKIFRDRWRTVFVYKF